MKWPRVDLKGWWRLIALALIGAALATFLLTFRLVSLAPMLSPTESATVAHSAGLAQLLNDPLDLPYKLLVWLARILPYATELWRARLPSVILGIVSLSLAAYVLQRWYGRRSMIFGMAIFAGSAWFLHVARFASVDIEYFAAILALLAAYIHLHNNKDRKAAWYSWLVVNSVLLLIPGMVWFVLLSLVWQWRALAGALSGQSALQRTVSCLVPLLTVCGLVVTFFRHSEYALAWLGLPARLTLRTLRAYPSDLLQTLSHIAWRGPHRPELWLGQLPLLNVLLLLMLAAGLFFYIRHWRAARTQLLASFLVLAVLLISAGVVSLSTVVPLLYVVIVAGIAYMLHFWLRVFPRNPIARAVGIGLVGVLVGMSCYYSLAQYFIAWPHNAEVESAYHTAPRLVQ